MGFTALLEKIFFQIGQICIANTIIGLTVQTLHETGLHVNKRNYLFSQKRKKKKERHVLFRHKTCYLSTRVVVLFT